MFVLWQARLRLGGAFLGLVRLRARLGLCCILWLAGLAWRGEAKAREGIIWVIMVDCFLIEIVN